MVRLRLLGETAIDVDGTPVGPESQVLFAVLLVLALERGKRIARPALHRLLWPDADEDSGRHNLRQVLYKLRQVGAPLDATQSSVMLPAAQVTGELVELMTQAGAIGQRLVAGRRVGELLPGYAPAFSAPFADWVDEQRALLHAQLRRALLGALSDARTLGQWREVEAIAREVLHFDPLNEEATLALAESTALAGAKAQAIGIIDRYLDEIGGRGVDLRLPATVLRRRIAERFPAHRYVSAADACFVGRATEMADLLRLWHRARERRGGAALLWGEPGIGKTRLALELGKVAVLQGAQVQRVASRSWDVHRPLGAIVDLVPPLRELPGAAGIDPSCHAYLDRLTKHDPSRTLADLPDPATLHRQVRQAVFDLIDALLAEAPLVLVFEDVQWLDASSWEVLAELLRLARTRRLLLVLTSRVLQPPQLPESEDWEALRRIRVGGLDTAATHELLDAMTREAGRYIDPEYREWCVPLANGNPLHVQEIALQWLEKGSVREAPGSLRAMVEARIARLSGTALRCLQTIALAGCAIPPAFIGDALSERADAMLSAMDELELKRLISIRSNLVGSSHAIIADLALACLHSAGRLILHEVLAHAFDRASTAQQNPRWLWNSYRHWTHVGDLIAANSALTRFTHFLLGAGSADACLHLLNSALAECADAEEAGRLEKNLVLVNACLGRWSRVSELLNRAPLCAPVFDAHEATDLLHLFEARWRMGSDIMELRNEAWQLSQSPSLPLVARVRSAAWAAIFSDNLHDIDAINAAGAFACNHACDDDEVRAYSLQCRLITAMSRYDHDSMIADARSVEQAAYKLSNANEKCRLLRNAAQALVCSGELAEASRLFISTIAIAERTGAWAAKAPCVCALGYASLHSHDLVAARSWAIEAEHTFDRHQNRLSDQALSYLWFQVAAIDEDEEKARQCAEFLGSPEPGDVNARRMASQLSIAVRLLTLTASPAHDAAPLIASGEAFVRRFSRLYFLDFLSAGIVRARMRLSDTLGAMAFLEEYEREHRAERGPLHLDLHLAKSLLFTVA